MKEILEEIGNELIEEIRKRLATRGYQGKGFDDTGRASESLNADANIAATKLVIKGERYIGALDKGRRPTMGGGKKWSIESMMGWVERKLGIPSPKSKSIAFVIMQKIHKTGTALYRKEYQGLELEDIKKMGIDLIKKRITSQLLIDTKAKVKDLSKGAMA